MDAKTKILKGFRPTVPIEKSLFQQYLTKTNLEKASAPGTLRSGLIKPDLCLERELSI